MKRILLAGVILWISLCTLSGCSGVEQEVYDKLQSEYDSLQEVTDQLRSDYDSAMEQYDALKEEYDVLFEEKQDIEEEYKKYQEEMQPYYEYVMNLQNMGQQGGAADQAAYEQQIAQAQMAELAQTYETGITYEQLMTDPDTYLGQKVKFSGQVLLSNTEGDNFNFLLAVDGDLSKPMLFAGSKEWADAGLVQGSVVTVYGTSVGLYEYDTSFLTEYLLTQENVSAEETGNAAAETVPDVTPTPEAAEENKTDNENEDANAKTGSKIPGVSFEYIV